jgi:hypothetical protein
MFFEKPFFYEDIMTLISIARVTQSNIGCSYAVETPLHRFVLQQHIVDERSPRVVV